MPLEAYSTVPNLAHAPHKTASILLVGVDGSGKRTLFKLLKEQSQKKNITLEIHSINVLPLPEKESRLRMDFIVFLVDMTNKVSFESTKTCLERHVHPDYLLGRSCLVATKADLTTRYAFVIKDLDVFADIFNIPIIVHSRDTILPHPPHFASSSAASSSPSSNNSSTVMADKIIRMVELANHYSQSKVTPLLLHTLDLSMIASTKLLIDQ